MAFGKLLFLIVFVNFTLLSIALTKSDRKRPLVPSYDFEKFVGNWYIIGVLMNPILRPWTAPASCIQMELIQQEANMFSIKCNVSHVVHFGTKNWAVEFLNDEIHKNSSPNTENVIRFFITDYNKNEIVFLDMQSTFILMMSRNTTISDELWKKYQDIFTGTQWSMNRVVHDNVHD